MNEANDMRPPHAFSDLLDGARLLEVHERSSAYDASKYAGLAPDSCPILVFDRGVLTIGNPYSINCDSGERVSLGAIIGCCVSHSFATHTEAFVVFEGRIYLGISLRDEDLIGPEAASFRANTGEIVSVK